MKKLDRTHRTYFLIVAALILFILCITGIAYHGDTGDAQIVEHEEIPVIPEEGSVSGSEEISEKTDEPNKTEDTEKSDETGKPGESVKYEESEISYELETFGNYLELLYREGRRTELDDRIISEMVDEEKAVVLSKKSPLLEHLRKKENYVFAADVNRDGVKDVVEYGFNGEIDGVNTGVLAIYLGIEGGGFTLSCSKPILPILLPKYNRNAAVIIDIIEYGGETYLLFRLGYDASGKQQNRVIAYWLSNGAPNGKLEFKWECRDIDVAVTEKENGYNAGFLEEDRMLLYHRINNEHCEIDRSAWYQEGCREWKDIYGSGEKMISQTENEEIREGYGQKYRAEQKPYLEKYKEINEYNITEMIDMYESDLNNDGIIEKYVKAAKELCLREGGITGRKVITGEYYGTHEGRMGLMYYMESGGEETDFLKMCGLDIWGGEMTPQNFWVEKTEKGNVTYIAYQDGEEHRQFIEGYLIQGDRYERVVSAWYVPKIECSIDYEPVEEPEGVGYVVHRSEDGKSFEIEWGEGNDKEETVNRRIRELLEEAMGTIDLMGGKFGNVSYEPKEAGRESFTADCTIYYAIPWREGQDEECYMKNFRICINVITGECEGIYDDVIYGSLKNEYNGPQYEE